MHDAFRASRVGLLMIGCRCIGVLIFTSCPAASAFSPRASVASKWYHVTPCMVTRLIIPTILFESGESNDGLSEVEQTPPADEEKSMFDKINAILDTPILDANDRSDQGPLAEALKRFVRREPQIASNTFSVVVVTFMFVLVRIFNFITYGI